MSKPMDDAQTDAPVKSITLSDGWTWTKLDYPPDTWCGEKTGSGRKSFVSFPFTIGRGFTASDLRAIADVLDPPAALASPRAPESHAGDPFESPAHAVARLSAEVHKPSPDWRDSEAEPSDAIIRQMVRVLDARNTPKSEARHGSAERMGYESFLAETARGLYSLIQSHARPSKD